MPVGEENPGEKETIQTSLVITFSTDSQTQTMPMVPDQATQPQSRSTNPDNTLVILPATAGLTFSTRSFTFRSLLEYSIFMQGGKKYGIKILITWPNVKKHSK